MTNVNQNSVIVLSDRVEKTYRSLERYESEAENMALFEREGFRVPKIITSDEKALVQTISRVEGNVGDDLSFGQVLVCADVLKRIYVIFHDRFDADEVSKSYIANLRGAVKVFVGARPKYAYNDDAFENVLGILADHFMITLFKDAKSSNWVFADDGVSLIDFDYVRPSFFLSDIAQLINYADHLEADQVSQILSHFIVDIHITQDIAEVLLKLARVNSYIMALKHGPQAITRHREVFAQSAVDVLVELGVIYER